MPTATAPVLVLLEGPSDVAALEVVLERRAVPSSAYRLLDLGGVTNTARALREAADRWPDRPVVGLCDAGEAGVVVRALGEQGRPVRSVDDLAHHGFFRCDRDLEEELIRALGVQRCLEVLEDLGLGRRFLALGRQPAWEGRPVEARLHRFAGVASGRKVRLARAMAVRLAPGSLPPPLAALVARVEELAAGRPGG